MATVKTRILILSDTHGLPPSPESHPTAHPSSPSSSSSSSASPASEEYFPDPPAADVALHCGDLTARSRLIEYRSTIALLRRIRAPLKLLIAGNHDTSLDPSFATLSTFSPSNPRPRPRPRPRGFFPPSGPATALELTQLLDDARARDNIVHLSEGTHEFRLQNGATLRVFASPCTPEYGLWAFQYPYGEHVFPIPRLPSQPAHHPIPPDCTSPNDSSPVDIAMTHGPPLGILDRTRSSSHAGCPALLRAVAAARPRIHCFGHIHESWGAYLGTWRDKEPDHTLTASACRDQHHVTPLASPQEDEAYLHALPSPIDPQKSRLIASLEQPPSTAHDQRCVPLDLTRGGDAIAHGQQTLFVNAAIMDVRYRPTQLPWLIDVDLPKTDS